MNYAPLHSPTHPPRPRMNTYTLPTPMNGAASTSGAALASLAAAWQQAKSDEEAARARRYEIEARIVQALPARDEGTSKAEDAGLRVSVTYKLTRSVDSAALREQWSLLPEKVQAVFRWSADIDTRKLRAAQDMAPDAYAEAARYITTRPAKPAVKVEAL